MITHLHDKARETLEEMMRDAELYAINEMKISGRVNPALLIHGIDGFSTYLPPLSDGLSKDNFAEIARMMCTEQAADAVVFVSEAWMRLLKNGEKLDLSKAPSQCPDRQEVLILMGESIGGANRKQFPIVRSTDGQFVAFDHNMEIMHERVEGRFAQFLPETYPTPKEREYARHRLERMGISKGNEDEHTHTRGRGMM